MSAAEATSLKDPEIEDLKGAVTVRFRPSHYLPPQRVGRDITERQRSILGLLGGSPDGIALRHIHAQLGADIGMRLIREDLTTLRVLGLAVPYGFGRGARWKRQ